MTNIVFFNFRLHLLLFCSNTFSNRLKSTPLAPDTHRSSTIDSDHQGAPAPQSASPITLPAAAAAADQSAAVVRRAMPEKAGPKMRSSKGGHDGMLVTSGGQYVINDRYAKHGESMPFSNIGLRRVTINDKHQTEPTTRYSDWRAPTGRTASSMSPTRVKSLIASYDNQRSRDFISDLSDSDLSLHSLGN